MQLAHHSWGSASAPPALLVHGLASSRATWNRVGPWLAGQGWHAIAVDLRGHGESQLVSAGEHNDRSLRTLASDLVETVAVLRPDAEGVDLLVGHSLGALVSLICVVDDPTFARLLVLEDPSGDDQRSSIDVQSKAAGLVGEMDRARSDPDDAFEKWSAWDGRVPAETVRNDVAAFAAADPLYVPELLRELYTSQFSLVGLAERCTTPALLLVGRDARGDSVSDASESDSSRITGEDRKRFRAAMRHGTMVELDAGHGVHDAVFDDYVAQLDRWLVERAADGLPTARRRP
jgi:pimeloyl-ACP methyl ester carboxylesterase